MRSTRVAEWVLAQVTSRERAAAVIGDLLEKVPARGQLWFWWSVVTTAVALVWRDVAASPMRMLRLGFAAFLLQFVLVLPLSVVAFITFAVIAAVNHRPPTVPFAPDWPAVVYVVVWCVVALIQFAVGRWLARRSPDHELAPCVAYSILGLTFSLAWSLSASQPGALQMIRSVASSAGFVVWDLPLYAGAVSIRRKRAA
jgi:hypothetical protein